MIILHNIKLKNSLGIICSLILICTILTGCFSPKKSQMEPVTTERETVARPDDDDPQTEKLKVQEDFNDFLDEIFEKLITESTFTLRLRLKNPEAFGIDAVPVRIDSFDDTYVDNMIAQTNKWMTALKDFEYDYLTSEQKYTYDILEGCFNNDLLICENYIFYEPLSPMSGMQNQLPILFYELPMEDEEDIKECIQLLNTLPDYFKTIMDFEYKKAQNNCFMSENALNEIVKQCNELANADGFSFLIEHFTSTINDMASLTDEQKTVYTKELTDAVTYNFIDGYSYLADELTIIEATYKCNNVGLSITEKSKEYYEALIESYTGSGRTISELITMTEDALEDNLYSMQLILLANPDALEGMDDYTMPHEDNPEEALKYLLKEIEKDFPKAPVTSFNVLTVDKAMEDMLSPAFYMLPAIDDLSVNNIFVNYSEEYADMDLFPTLAHEGFPGHLYQTTYFASTNPHPLRQIVAPIGYSEGWAKYVETYSYELAGLDDYTAELLAIDQLFGFGLYSRVDMGIHYEGWNLQDTRKFLSTYGITDSDVISEIYYTILDNPGVYLQYYIGCLEILQLKETAKASLGADFSLLSFHKFILDCGPSQFYLIEEKFDKWLEMAKMK